MGRPFVRAAVLLAAGLAALAGCAETPEPTYAGAMSAPRYSYPQAYPPAFGYAAMTCGAGAPMPVAGAYAQSYTPVFCPVAAPAASWPYATPAYPGYAAAPAPIAPAFGAVSSTAGSVTIYTSSGCGPCKKLQHELSGRNVPYLAIDVDQNHDAYLRAQVASGGKSGVPLTDINQGAQDVWILGDDADAVERAYRQN